MSIHRYLGQPLTPGMIVCAESNLRDGFCGVPFVVEKVTEKSVFLRSLKNGEAKTKRLSSIVFVCDTQADGFRAYEASFELVRSEIKLQEQWEAMRVERRRLAVEALESEG